MTMEAEGVVLERIEVELEPDCDVDGLVTGYLSDELLLMYWMPNWLWKLGLQT